jgi:hypothetical protein
VRSEVELIQRFTGLSRALLKNALSCWPDAAVANSLKWPCASDWAARMKQKAARFSAMERVIEVSFFVHEGIGIEASVAITIKRLHTQDGMPVWPG